MHIHVQTCPILTFATPITIKSYSLDFLFFFFSSRRRHTRSKRDWSSDVCSSDLSCSGNLRSSSLRTATASSTCPPAARHSTACAMSHAARAGSDCMRRAEASRRSEERRVGKECRSRWAPDQEDKEYKQGECGVGD